MMPFGAECADVVVAHVPGMDLAVDADLAHAPRDQLGVLRAEVENQDPMGVDVGVRSRRRARAALAASCAIRVSRSQETR